MSPLWHRHAASSTPPSPPSSTQSSKLADVLDIFMILGEQPGAPSPAAKRRSAHAHSDDGELVEIDDPAKCETQ